MELTELAKKYGDFYAPSYVVRIGGSDLMREHAVAVSQVEVDLVMASASRFSFTLTDCYSHEHQTFRTRSVENLLELLTFGAEVEIFMGYRDVKSMPIAMRGIITAISTNFPESGAPELSIAGYDHGYLLTLGKNSRSWSKKSDSDAVHDIASSKNLAAIIETTTEKYPQIEQNLESDWDFLKKLALRNEFALYVDETKTLHFAPRNSKGVAVVKLVYGQGLLNFKPEANLAGQISKVEIYSWDPIQGKAIVGVATTGEESGRTGESAGKHMKSGLVVDPTKRPTLRLRQPVFTQSEANERAKAALTEVAKNFLTGDGETIGLPEVRPDRNIELAKLGAFSKTYYIEQATHKIDSNGYRTKFKVKEPSYEPAGNRAN